jgi:hypothetical protein
VSNHNVAGRPQALLSVTFSLWQWFERDSRPMRNTLFLLPVPLLLGGCVAQQIAETAVSVVTLPVRAVGAGVDAVTTSQSEADQRRGREIRKEEERLGREQRRQERERAREQRRTAPAEEVDG